MRKGLIVNSKFELVAMLNDAAGVLADRKTEVESSLESTCIKVNFDN
jgi:hypothetical protein